MAKSMKQKLHDTLRRRIANMRRNGSTRDVMETAVWNTLQTHTHYKITAKGYIAPADASDLWARLTPFFDGDPEVDGKRMRPRTPRRTRVKRMPRDLRNLLDVQKMERREDYFRRGTTYEGGPLHDPLYENWLIENGIHPADYLARFNPADGWEAPPWAAKYGVVWPDPDDFDDEWDADPAPVEPFQPDVSAQLMLDDARELVTA